MRKGTIEVDDGGAGEGVEGGREVGHGGGEDGGDEEAGDAVGHLLDDEGGEDAVVGAEGLAGWLAVEDEEAYADEEEEGELEEDDGAGGEEGEAGLAEVAGGEEALDHELVGAVGGHGEEGAAEDAGPEGVGLVVRVRVKSSQWNLPSGAATAWMWDQPPGTWAPRVKSATRVPAT